MRRLQAEYDRRHERIGSAANRKAAVKLVQFAA
jgi:hypothetical protein